MRGAHLILLVALLCGLAGACHAVQLGPWFRNGTLNVTGSGTVTANSLTAYSTNGDIVIGEPVNVNDFYADATNGNLVINGNVDVASQFTGIATAISGTGSITATYITLQSSGTATLLQTGPITFAYNGTLTLDADAEAEPDIDL